MPAEASVLKSLKHAEEEKNNSATFDWIGCVVVAVVAFLS